MGFPGDSVVKKPSAIKKMQVQSLGQKDPLEKEMLSDFSILVRKNPMPEEPGKLQSTEPQRNWTRLSTHAHTYPLL